MKKTLFMLSLAAAAFLMISCGTTKEAAKAESFEKTKAPAHKVIGAEGVEQPDWVNAPPVPDDNGLYGVGSAKMSSKQYSLSAAQLAARTNLAYELKVEITATATKVGKDTGMAQDAINGFEEKMRQSTDQMLQGSRQVDRWVDQDETVWILMFLPYKAMLPAVNESVKEYSPSTKSEITDAYLKAAAADLDAVAANQAKK
jgi:hypothetical protein